MEQTYKVQTRFLFHSDIRIKIPSDCDDRTFDILYKILEDVDDRYNSYSKNSYISKINRNSGSFVKVDRETVEILEKVMRLSDFFEGEYDITVMPLIKVWGFYRKGSSKVPSREELEQAKKLVGYRRIEIDRENMRVKIDPDQEIITGSFIKAYAIDKAVAKMREIGIKDAVINAGGSSIAAINEWDIIIENPEPEKEIQKDESGKALKITGNAYRESDEYNDLFQISISDKSYSTSNQANTYLEIDGKKYGHIISPKTCYPGRNKQIGIITGNAFYGDIISTGLYNQTPENFYKIMNRLKREMDIEGYLIDEDGNIHYSENFLTTT